MKMNLKLRLFFYGKNALNDILNINKSLKLELIDDMKYKILLYFGIDKISKWEYLIFQKEINNKYNDIIKAYLTEHLNREFINIGNDIIM